MTEVCDICKARLIVDETKEIAGTMYKILKCNNCKKKIVRQT